MKRNSNEKRIHFPPRTFAAGHRGFTAIWTCNPREELRTILSISPRPSQEFTRPFRNPAPGSENSPRNSPCLWDIYACWKNGTVVFVSYTGSKQHKGARCWRWTRERVIRRGHKVVTILSLLSADICLPPSFSITIINFDVVRLRFTLQRGKVVYTFVHASNHCHSLLIFFSIPPSCP